ncbi:hypothetical protein Hdeb2414_s0007g00237691 [Helianthus debilis subsp. tardiflorus]
MVVVAQNGTKPTLGPSYTSSFSDQKTMQLICKSGLGDKSQICG